MQKIMFNMDSKISRCFEKNASIVCSSDNQEEFAKLRALDTTVLRELLLIVRLANNGGILFKASGNFGVRVDHYFLH